MSLLPENIAARTMVQRITVLVRRRKKTFALERGWVATTGSDIGADVSKPEMRCQPGILAGCQVPRLAFQGCRAVAVTRRVHRWQKFAEKPGRIVASTSLV